MLSGTESALPTVPQPSNSLFAESGVDTIQERNIDFMRDCTGIDGIIYQGGPKRFANGAYGDPRQAGKLRDAAHLLCGRLLYFYDDTVHRVHGNGADRPHMWYCRHPGEGHGQKEVARFTAAAQEPDFMEAHDLIVKFSMPPGLRKHVESGQAQMLGSGFIVENVRLKVRRSLATTSSGRNPEGSKPYRKYRGFTKAVAERPAMTPEARLYRDSSGNPQFSWQHPSLVSDHQGALGYVHVDSHAPASEAVVNVIVIISEHGGTFVSVLSDPYCRAAIKQPSTYLPGLTFLPFLLPNSPHGLCV